MKQEILGSGMVSIVIARGVKSVNFGSIVAQLQEKIS